MYATSDITMWSLSSLARALACGELSSTEIVTAHADRMEALDRSINAVVQLPRERALEEAALVDTTPSEPGDSVLRGLPFTVKDNFETEGVVTAVGMTERADEIPARDAALVEHVRRRGAILLAKTNCPPGGAGLFTDNDLYGRTNNPYDLTRTPGGSSGGEAAAIATGMSPLGFGTDSGGSVRVPAHFCGIAAILPTQRLLPLLGVLDDEGPLGSIGDPRTRVGVMARTVADLTLALEELLPVTASEEAAAPLALDRLAAARDGVRVGVLIDNGVVSPSNDTAAAVTDAATALEEAGATVRETALPSGGHEITHQVWLSYRGEMSTRELYAVMRRWDAYRREVMNLFAAVDVILCPVFDSPAPKHGQIEWRGQGVSYTTPFSLTECPSAVVRCGTSDEGMPVGVQIVARPWGDRIALAAATLLETELGGWRPPHRT